jgi:TIR domain
MQKIVFLYNDRDRPIVSNIRFELMKRWPQVPVWMASEDLTAFGDIFQQIETAIEGASGVVLFLGRHGLGRFQEHIELVAVSIERWQQGAKYGCLLVHLEPELEVPRRLLGFATVNHDGILTGTRALAAAIAQRFGWAKCSEMSSL